MSVKEFTGWEYLLIDAANQYGLDKATFEERIEWATAHLDELETMGDKKGQWKEKPLYQKAVMAIRDAQTNKPTGHLVGLDAACSGMQIMSAMTGCQKGGLATGLVDPAVCADAYSICTTVMNRLLKNTAASAVNIPRKSVKQAVMTYLYGSKKEPKKLFGEDTDELKAFHLAVQEIAPGAVEALHAFVASWQPYSLSHDWELPDGYNAHVKVMETVAHRIELDELNGVSFTYQGKENIGCARAVKNAANIVHSVDAYVLRSLVRRCNYDLTWVTQWQTALEGMLLQRELGDEPTTVTDYSEEATRKLQRYQACLMADITLLDHIRLDQIGGLGTAHIRKLLRTVNQMLTHVPFEVVTIHDEFKAHANHLNSLRMHYREILAEIAESDLLADLLSQVTHRQVTVRKHSQVLPQLIRNSNYAIS